MHACGMNKRRVLVNLGNAKMTPLPQATFKYVFGLLKCQMKIKNCIVCGHRTQYVFKIREFIALISEDMIPQLLGLKFLCRSTPVRDTVNEGYKKLRFLS